jgi:hypothetical protein
MLDNQTKACTKCGVDKPLTEFSKCTIAPTGRQYTCKVCQKDHDRVRWANITPEERALKAEYDRKYREKNKEQLSEKNRKWRAENKELIAAKKKAYSERNKAEISEKRREFRKNNKELCSEQHKKEAHKRSARARKRNTGYSGVEFEKAIMCQDNQCAICHIEFGTLRGNAPHADHDHVTSEKRGVLCGSCNRALGLLNDSAILLRRAAEYIENPPLRGVL